MKTTLVLLLLFTSILAATGQSQSYLGFYPVSFRKATKQPYVGGDSAHFAYVRESGTLDLVYLAEMTGTVPEPKARNLKRLLRFETDGGFPGVSEDVVDMSASPDNRYLLVYSLEDGHFYNDGFLDYNIRIFDMVTGTQVGRMNEHSFSGIFNEGVTSQVLYDYLIETGVPHEYAVNGEAMIVTEGVFEANPRWQWNDDGSLTIFMSFDVHESYEGISVAFAGVEEFSITYEISPSGFHRQGFNLVKSPAGYSATFPLAIDQSGRSEMTFMNREILFRETRLFGRVKGKNYYVPKSAKMIEGNIPRQYRWSWGY